ncbi:hypothetical protein [Streptosporangium roseum]|uniref:hypothetical protein n=1 Tax=Streptosporangium roseum TaxID=2001 RepID=UPI0004CD89B9|nr:hypothetical protein [Streptosporangium roseum]
MLIYIVKALGQVQDHLEPRFFAWGQAVRLVAMMGLFFHAMMSCVWLADLLRLHGIFDSLSADYQTALGTTGSAQRLQEIVRMFTYLLWIAAFASLVDGRPRTAKALVLIALVLFYSPILQARGLIGDQSGKALALHSLLLVGPVLALLAGFHRDAPRARHSWWGAALPVSLGALLYMILNVLGSASMAPTINWQFWSWMWPWMGESGLACLALLTVSVTCIGMHLWVPTRRTPYLPLALAILAVPVMLARVFYLTFDAIDPATQTMAAVNVSQLLALLLCALTLTVLTAKTMPALPQTTPSSP